MATASIVLPIGAATLPDGSSGNAAPQIERLQGTEANPKKHIITARFDPATEEFLYWSLMLLHEAAAAPLFTLRALWGSITAITATNVVWGGRITAISGGDADTPIEHAQAAQQTVTDANDTVEAGRANPCSIAFTNVQADGATADDLVIVAFSRVAANGSDTLAEDARLYGLELTYDLA